YYLLAAEGGARSPFDDGERLAEVEMYVRREPARARRQTALELEQLAVRVVPVRQDGKRPSTPRVRVHAAALDHQQSPSLRPIVSRRRLSGRRRRLRGTPRLLEPGVEEQAEAGAARRRRARDDR